MTKPKKNVFIVFIFIILFLLSGVLITTGLYFYKISQKDYIFHKAIDTLFEKGYELSMIDQNYLLGDSFLVEGNIKIDVHSDYYEKNISEGEEFVKKNKLLHNLSLLDTNYIIGQDHTKKEFYTYCNGKINDKDIFLRKKLISNSTEYLFYNGVNEQYINNGNNTYFESLNTEITTIDNINYLYYFIRDSLKSHITLDDLEIYDVNTYIGDEEQNVKQISYKITNDSLKTLNRAILKDIQKDDRAKDIVSIVYPNIDKLKINDKKRIIPKGEDYIINIYVSNKNYDVVKYEIVKMKSNDKEIYSYEGTKDEGIFYYVRDNEVKYSANYKASFKKMDIEVFDRFNKSIGSIHREKDKNTIIVNVTLDLENKKYDITYNENYDNLSSEGYNKTNLLSFKIMEQMINKIQGEIKVESRISKNVKIDEDISNSVLRVGFSEEDEDKFNSYYDNIINRLES